MGEWLQETFTSLFARFVPVAVLLVVVTAMIAVACSLFAWLAVADLRFANLRGGGDLAVSGLRPGPLVAAAVVGLASIPVTLITMAAAGHQLHAVTSGATRSVGSSLAVGVRRLPRALGWSLVAAVAVLVPVAVAVLGPVVLAIATDGPAPLLLWLVTLPLVVGLFLWLGVRVFHGPAAVLLAPPGTSPVRTSFALTRNRWVATLGRALLLLVLLVVVQSVFQVVSGAVGQAAAVAAIDTDPATGELLIDGRPLSEVDAIVVGDLIPGAPLMVVLGLLGGLAQGVSNALWISGAVGLYRRAGGPVDDRL